INQPPQLHQPGKEQLVLHHAVLDATEPRLTVEVERIGEGGGSRFLGINVLSGRDRLLDVGLAQVGRDRVEIDGISGIGERGIEVGRDARDAMGAGKHLELPAVAAHQHRIRHDPCAIAERDAAIGADRQHRTEEMLGHPHPSGHPVHDDAEAPLRHRLQAPTLQTIMAANGRACRIEPAALTARAACRTLMPKMAKIATAREEAMRTTRRSLLQYGAALASLPLIGRPACAQAQPIRIGVLYALSGPFAAAGSVASSIGAQIAIDLTNERGGVLGKYKIEPVSADSQSKPDVAINEAERLVNQEKVNIVLGVYSSAHAVPLAAKMQSEKKILWITTAVASSVFKNKNLTYTFRAQIHSDQYGEAGAGFIADNAKAKLGQDPKDVKLAIIYEDGPYGTGCGDADEQYSKAKGMTQ